MKTLKIIHIRHCATHTYEYTNINTGGLHYYMYHTLYIRVYTEFALSMPTFILRTNSMEERDANIHLGMYNRQFLSADIFTMHQN